MDQLPYPTVEELLAELKARGGYNHVVLGDTEFEFAGVDGNLLRPVCGVFKDLANGQEWRLRRGEFGAAPPFSTGPDTLFVAYYASAEMGFFRAVPWPMPVRILDLFTEFRNFTNGLPVESNKLIHALEYFGLDTIGAHYKEQMIELILRGPPWTEEEWQAILDYCAGDVYALERLLPAMLPHIDLPRALFRGRFMGALAVVENYGVPIDVPTISLAQKHWTDIQDDLIAEVDADYGVFDGRTFKEERFEAYLERHNIPWPRLESGRLDLDDSKRHVFRDMAKIYPNISPLRELRHALSTMRLFSDLTIGEDGRNRALLSAFRSITGRNQPSNANFIFGTSTWIRGFIKPPPGHAVAYIDWVSQEVCIGAALSGDKNMMADTAAGRDPYIEFGIRAGLLPAGATKKGNEDVRDMLKACVLGTQYGMGPDTLAFRIGKSTITARQLICSHQNQYPDFWKMAEGAVNCAMQGQSIGTVFGWNVRAGPQARWRSLMNFPMQANGSEMMRLACCTAIERGIEVCAQVHDAFLICAPLDQIDARVVEMKFIMEEASRIVLDGFTVRADCPEFDGNGKLLEFPMIIRYPNRFMIKRGVGMWTKVMKLLQRFREEERDEVA
jgi:DNA polymerase-1